MPFPLHDGGACSLYQTALGLILQGTDLKIMAINTPKDWVDGNIIPADFREKTGFEFSIVDTRVKPLKALINLFSGRSYFIERFFSEQFRDGLIRILTGEEFDIIHLEHIYLCVYLDTIRKYSKAKVILRPQNVENLVWKRLLRHKINPASEIYLRIASDKLEHFEVKMANRVDGIMAISSCDAETFNTYAPDTPLVTVPIGFDFNRITAYDCDKQFIHFPVFYHLGSMDWAPNVQGLKWFIEEVIPFIIKDSPGFILRIAGKKMPQWFYKRQSRNLMVDGEVGESLTYHEDKAILIVPLLSGGGIRAKIIEGMALGKTIISTTIGAEGIPYTDQENILIADNKEEFAIRIKKCMSSKEFCQKIGRNAQILAKENYDCNKTAESMMKFYSNVMEGSVHN